MKYRILECNGKYKLQYRILFWWEDSQCSIKNSLQEAREWKKALEKEEDKKSGEWKVLE